MSESNGNVPRLNQVLAIEKGVKERVQKEVTALYHSAQKPELFNGFIKQYRKLNEAAETYPDERKKVQMIAEDALTQVIAHQTELADVMATKDWANCTARADIEIDGDVLVKDAPATFILAMEKQINDLKTFVTNLPVLDDAEDWTADVNSSLLKSGTITTHRTAKVSEPIVLYPATTEHPAQTQLVTKDVIVGFWDQVKHSGALPVPRKRQLLDRIEKLLRAIKTGREKANMEPAEKREVGAALYGYVLS
jgi:hypothetical protein